VRLWIPVPPALVLLAPVLLLALVVLVVGCLVVRVSPVLAIRVCWQVLWASGGTRVEVERDDMAVLVDLR